MYETLIEKWVLRSFWGVKLLSTINISWDTAILGFCWRQQEICSTVNKKIICPNKFFDIIVIEELYFEKQSFILPETAGCTCFWPPVNTLFFKMTSIQRPTTPNIRRFSPFFRCRPTILVFVQLFKVVLCGFVVHKGFNAKVLNWLFLKIAHFQCILYHLDFIHFDWFSVKWFLVQLLIIRWPIKPVKTVKTLCRGVRNVPFSYF